jgi:hypothetical protein
VLKRPSARHRRHRGQSLVELALVLPVVLLVALITLDFGRALYGWVIVQNSARIAANFAAANPDGWQGAGEPAIQAEYAAQIQRDLDTANCTAATPAPTPVFADGPDTAVGGGYGDTNYDVGDTVVVSLTCTFRPITPIIGGILGSNVQLGARSEFRIRSGNLVGLANPTRLPAPGPSPTPTPTPGATPTPTPGATPTPTPACPSVSFTATNNSNPGNPHRMNFSGSISPSSGGWTWTWSGAFSDTGQNINHNFASSGTATVTLTVTKGACTATSTQTVAVP